MTATHTLLLDDPVAYLATHREAVVLYWRATPTLDVVRKIDGHLRKYFQAKPGKIHCMVVMKSQVTLVDGEVRSAMTEVLKLTEAHYASVSIVLLQEGFFAAALRGILTGMQLVVRPPYPVKVFATMPEAIQNFRIQSSGLDIGGLLRAAEDRAG